MEFNPFTTHNYMGPEYFCDRNRELSRLLEMFDNQRFGLLYSMRRMGKTGLVHHFHHTLAKRKNVITVYCDVQNTRSDGEFVAKLISAVVAKLEPSQQGAIARIGKFFSSLRPVFTFDPVTNAPSVQLTIETPRDTEVSLEALMNMLGKLPGQVQITFDEFQQIGNYDQTIIDSTLRGYLSLAPNVHFLFCGSQQHMLLELFGDARKPFFSSVDHLQLGHIERSIYAHFIAEQFEKGGQKLDEGTLNEILEWTRGHTFYTQYLCNRIFSKGFNAVGAVELQMLKGDVLFSFEPSYRSLISVLSPNQVVLLTAIAKEGTIEGVGSAEFLSRYALPKSTAQQALGVLLKKELLYDSRSGSARAIMVYDPFFSRWLETQ